MVIRGGANIVGVTADLNPHLRLRFPRIGNDLKRRFRIRLGVRLGGIEIDAVIRDGTFLIEGLGDLLGAIRAGSSAHRIFSAPGMLSRAPRSPHG